MQIALEMPILVYQTIVVADQIWNAWEEPERLEKQPPAKKDSVNVVTMANAPNTTCVHLVYANKVCYNQRI